MPTPVLATKLYIPPAPPQAVARARLIARLNAGLHGRLTLISAPAGFGKTTLVSAWAAGRSLPVAWLSLEAADGDPARFLTYLVAALQTAAPQLGQGVLPALQSSPPPTEAILTALLNEIAALADKLVLVLDDYHAVDNAVDAAAIDQALAFLIEHLPPQLHLVITTREDPALPLARLRARGQLTELRAADLRFTPAEAAEFLGAVMGLKLTAAEIAALEARTEGWIAGLQLAALSLQGQPDASRSIQSFAGSHRFVLDYLGEEVLQQQPPDLRAFLLHTSILDRLCGPLCDAVAGQQGGSARLAALERGNFFVVPLDDQRQWFRYHHLFAGMLQAHLLAEQPALLPTLHRRASAWYADNGLPADAIRHALAAGDFERAADLIELASPAMRRSRQDAAWFGWLRALPDELLRRRPVLSVHHAGMSLHNGELEAAAARLRDAERWLDAAGRGAQPSGLPGLPGLPAEMVVTDAEQWRGLESSIAMYRAAIALIAGDVTGTQQQAQRALDAAPADDHLGRGGAAGFLGLAAWTNGELETAHAWYRECMAQMQQAGHSADVLGCALALADIRLAQGKLRAAMRTYAEALQFAAERGAPGLRGTADMHVGMSAIYYERNDLEAAGQQLLQSKALGELAGAPQNPYRRRAAQARLAAAQGDLDGALDLLQAAERLYVGDFFPDARPLTARKARIWLRQGRLDEAYRWVRERGLSVVDDLSYLREFEHITLARLLLAQQQSAGDGGSRLAAMALLARLRQAAEAGERARSIIEILVLQALAYQWQGDFPAALAALERALALAEPEGFVRLFVDEGPPMAQLLIRAAQQGIAPTYVRQLLAALGEAEGRSPVQPELPARAGSPIEPLSERELEVLRLLAADLSGPEMARRLVVSLNTLRTHTKNIYAKLAVNSRRAAVRRAQELDLL